MPDELIPNAQDPQDPTPPADPTPEVPGDQGSEVTPPADPAKPTEPAKPAEPEPTDDDNEPGLDSATQTPDGGEDGEFDALDPEKAKQYIKKEVERGTAVVSE